MASQVLVATNRSEWSDGDDGTYSADASGGVQGLLSQYGGGVPTTITVRYRALSGGPDPSTISGILMFQSGLDLAQNTDVVVIPQDSVARDYVATLDFLATPEEIQAGLSDLGLVSLEFIYDGLQHVGIAEMSVEVEWVINYEQWVINDLGNTYTPPTIGPWIGGDDLVVEASRLRTLNDDPPHLSTPTRNDYSLFNLNQDVANAVVPFLISGAFDNAEYWYYALGFDPHDVAQSVVSVSTHIGGSFTNYDIDAYQQSQSLFTNAFPHGWTPPSVAAPGYIEYDGPSEPYLVSGHVEFNYFEFRNTARTPRFTGSGTLEIYKHLATPDGHLVPGTRTLVDTFDMDLIQDPDPDVTFTTAFDLTGDELEQGILIAPFIRIDGASFQFTSAVQASFDGIVLGVETTLDTAASSFVWHLPRYRIHYPAGY